MIARKRLPNRRAHEVVICERGGIRFASARSRCGLSLDEGHENDASPTPAAERMRLTASGVGAEFRASRCNCGEVRWTLPSHANYWTPQSGRIVGP
jgi:hypothetical protein